MYQFAVAMDKIIILFYLSFMGSIVVVLFTHKGKAKAWARNHVFLYRYCSPYMYNDDENYDQMRKDYHSYIILVVNILYQE